MVVRGFARRAGGRNPATIRALKPVSPDHVALGRAIRDLRVAAGISQEALAERCGLHRTYVGGIERGERNVSFSNLLKVARALGARPSALLALAEATQPATAQAEPDRELA